MNKVMNAFHPKYIETHMPDFMEKVRAEAAATANGIKSGITARASRESDGRTTVSALSDFPKTKPSLEPREFRIYSKAGAK